ncbi:MAG: hypothetical protein ABI772_09760 [Bacteroidota bacterium]
MIKKIVKPFLIFTLTTALFSCGNKSEQKEETSAVVDTPATVTTPETPAFQPFDIIKISHKVKDYAKWRMAFDKDSTARNASGLGFIVIGRNADNDNDLSIYLNVSDMEKAKEFAASPRLKDVMQQNGVISKPDIAYYHVIRFNAESKEKKWVTITHKVKDFDAWVKVYDDEGIETRKKQGMIDVVMARGVEDANMVHLVFDITDMDKAKAAIFSEEKKKLMMSAGVEGAPKIEFFTSAD